jgi:hypothetical protein
MMLAAVTPVFLPSGWPRGAAIAVLLVAIVVMELPFESPARSAFIALFAVLAMIAAISEVVSSDSLYPLIAVWALLAVGFAIDGFSERLDRAFFRWKRKRSPPVM